MRKTETLAAVVAAALFLPPGVAAQEASRQADSTRPSSVVFLPDRWSAARPAPSLPAPPQQPSFPRRENYFIEGVVVGLSVGMVFAASGEITPILIGAALGGFIGHNIKRASSGPFPELVQEVRGGAPLMEDAPEALLFADSLLSAGNADSAGVVAREYTHEHPDDARGFLLLGDTRLAISADSALSAYEEAARLNPADPDAPFRIARVAMLRGAWDDEARARNALMRVLELDPMYESAWRLWRTLFRSPETRLEMIRRLLPHEARPEVKAMLAFLAIEGERYWEADRLLDAALAADSLHPGWLALRAQSALEAGDTLVGLGFYRRALAQAAHDSAGVLWDQVVGIARPEEIRAWQAGIPPAERGAWLESFWARRNPNLFAGVNQRVAEHFARWRYARREYPLLFPLVGFHRSRFARALNAQPTRGERQFHLRCEVFEAPPPSTGIGPGPRGSVVGQPLSRLAYLSDDEKDWIRHHPDGVRGGLEAVLRDEGPRALEHTAYPPLPFDLGDVDSTAVRIGYNLATGLSDRGLAYLRLGAPERRVLGGDNSLMPECNTTELERWRYDRWGEIRFARPSAFSDQATLSEVVFRPIEEPQFQAMRAALTEDGTSVSAPLEFGVWTASLRNHRDPSLTDLLVVSTHGALAATLVAATGGERALVQSHRGVVQLTDEPGAYALLAHAAAAGVLGRQELRVQLRDFERGPAVSDLLVAKAWPGLVSDRAEMAARLSRDLTFQSGDTVRVYAELYDLASEGGRARYRVSYRLLRTGDLVADYLREEWPGAVMLEFERQASATAVTREVLDINPQRIPPGTWLLRVSLDDLITGSPIGISTIAFEVRE